MQGRGGSRAGEGSSAQATVQGGNAAGGGDVQQDRTIGDPGARNGQRGEEGDEERGCRNVHQVRSLWVERCPGQRWRTLLPHLTYCHTMAAESFLSAAHAFWSVQAP
ncbi:hypothetical protein GCM10009743_41220 [Kribbella swartbergensis]